MFLIITVFQLFITRSLTRRSAFYFRWTKKGGNVHCRLLFFLSCFFGFQSFRQFFFIIPALILKLPLVFHVKPPIFSHFLQSQIFSFSILFCYFLAFFRSIVTCIFQFMFFCVLFDLFYRLVAFFLFFCNFLFVFGCLLFVDLNGLASSFSFFIALFISIISV